MKSTKDKKGFTIIEVVIVLAIAGLIFAIVFWAVPNLQKGNRDNTRKTTIGTVLASLEQFASNSPTGLYPTVAASGAGSWGEFVTNYFPSSGGGLKDPLGGDYVLNTSASGAAALATLGWNQIIYRVGYTCSTTTNGELTAVSGSSRAIAVVVRLEQAGGYCLDNS